MEKLHDDEGYFQQDSAIIHCTLENLDLKNTAND